MLAGGGTCLQRGAADNESFPDALGGWTYFRAEIDDGQRYFYSPDGQTWVVQTKRGVTLTFGVIPDALAGGDRAVERGHDPLTPTYPAGTSALTAPLNPVYRWNLAKQTDASGNAVYYGWRPEGSPRFFVGGEFVLRGDGCGVHEDAAIGYEGSAPWS
jgi:hypothetical protein